MGRGVFNRLPVYHPPFRYAPLESKGWGGGGGGGGNYQAACTCFVQILDAGNFILAKSRMIFFSLGKKFGRSMYEMNFFSHNFPFHEFFFYLAPPPITFIMVHPLHACSTTPPRFYCLFVCFFSRPFRLFPALTICSWVSKDG